MSLLLTNNCNRKKSKLKKICLLLPNNRNRK